MLVYHDTVQVQPNAKRLLEHQRKKERRVAEKELAERQERVRAEKTGTTEGKGSSSAAD